MRMSRFPSTGRNIFWESDSYASIGEGYLFSDEITVGKITEEHGDVIRPRCAKTKDEKNHRVKDMAEVFTPSWICKQMCDVSEDELRDSTNGDWRKYILTTCLEISCGEAPFLVSRYDAVSGESIPIESRIGILDRKLREVGDNATDEEYGKWALLALGSCYGYEWQGDSLLLAREAVLASFVDYYSLRMGCQPSESLLEKAAEIVSWNLFQMDGLKGVVPGSCHSEIDPPLFGETSVPKPCPGCER